MLLPPDLEAPLDALRLRRPDLRLDLHWYPSVPSTMDVAMVRVGEGASSGVVVVADTQTTGRGRRGHTWESPPGAGLYLSMVWRPPTKSLELLPLITLAAGVGVRAGVEAATGLAADLKWPNDLLVGRRKLAGILSEGSAIGTPHQAVVIGVGINVLSAAYSPDVAPRATSLEGELGRTVDRGALLAEVMAALMDSLARLDRDPGGILQAWRTAAPSAAGTSVEWDAAAGLQRGTTAGIDESGALLVKTPGGVERIIAGELRWLIG